MVDILEMPPTQDTLSTELCPALWGITSQGSGVEAGINLNPGPKKGPAPTALAPHPQLLRLQRLELA